MNIAWLYILVALASAIGQFFDPAYESILPEVASDEQLAAQMLFHLSTNFELDRHLVACLKLFGFSEMAFKSRHGFAGTVTK